MKWACRRLKDGTDIFVAIDFARQLLTIRVNEHARLTLILRPRAFCPNTREVACGSTFSPRLILSRPAWRPRPTWSKNTRPLVLMSSYRPAREAKPALPT